ncbi:MAG: hypothetical protein H7257_09900 [Taibaiella sp.]|nr:hypothetical protein [Taibaiella sp.]
MNKIVKRILITVAVIIGLFLLAAVLVPVMFKDKILAIVKKEMNEKLNATTDFKDVDISLFQNFPQLSVSIEQLSIVGKESFKNDTLIAATSINLAVDLMKAIKGTYDILNVGLVNPRIHAIVHESGEANWNITKTEPAAQPNAESKPFSFKLRKYSIENAFVEYHDQQGKTHVMIENLSHSGSGDFTQDVFTLATNTSADAFTFASGNIPYMNKVKMFIDLDLQIDNKANKYSFNTDKIQLNGLKLSTSGFVQMPDTSNILMDVQFSTPSNDFKDILSLVPGIYQNNFKDIKTTGKATLSGAVKGTYNNTQLPAYHLDLAIQDGSFQYPDLPQKVANIQVKMKVDNADGITDHTIVNIEKGHIEFGGEPFDFRLLLKTPVSNQWVDASMKGKIDLSKMQQFMKMEAGTKLTGLITASVAVKGSIAAAQKNQLEQLDASGTIGINNLVYASKDYPDGINLNSLTLTFNPKNVTVSNLSGRYLQTNFNGDGYINNLLGYYLHNDPLNASLHLSADKLDVNKWIGTGSAEKPAATNDSPAVVFIVPDNLDIAIKTEIGTLHYDNLTLTAVSGGLVVRNQVINIQNLISRGLDGTIKMNGFYSTKMDKKHPDIQFDYTVEGIDVQKTYNTFGFVQKMMPAGKYISGKVSSTLSITGKLGPDMAPLMNTLSGKGNMLMLSGLLSNFPVTDQLATKLNLQQLKSLPLKDMKLFFEFENGRVVVQPYKLKVDQIEAEIAGSHGFDQSLKYGINLTAPTALMGAQGTAMVNKLIAQASGKGVNLKLGDKVNLAVTIGGTVSSPKIETNLKSMAGNAVDNVKKQIEEIVQKKVDSVKTILKDTVKAIKSQAVNVAKEELKKQLMGDTTGKSPAKDAAKDAGDKVKEGLNDLFKRKKK